MVKKEKYFEGGTEILVKSNKKSKFISKSLAKGEFSVFLLDPIMAYHHNLQGLQLDSKNVNSYSKFKLSQKCCMKNMEN